MPPVAKIAPIVWKGTVQNQNFFSAWMIMWGEVGSGVVTDDRRYLARFWWSIHVNPFSPYTRSGARDPFHGIKPRTAEYVKIAINLRHFFVQYFPVDQHTTSTAIFRLRKLQVIESHKFFHRKALKTHCRLILSKKCYHSCNTKLGRRYDAMWSVPIYEWARQKVLWHLRGRALPCMSSMRF